jgi:chorismate dehydratase
MSIDLKKIGSVPYLNARPLIYGIEDQIVLQVPSVLSKNLRSGELDAALVPVAEYFENPEYQIVSEIGIASKGEIQSVYVSYKGELSNVKRVVLDPSSKTSNLLVQVIFSEFLKMKVEFIHSAKEKESPHLLIGDPALMQRDQFLQEGFQLVDLGKVWSDHTELPFVYAFWAVRRNVDAEGYAGFLRQRKKEGLSAIDRIVMQETIVAKEIAQSYLTKIVSYDLGPTQIKGLEKFQELCLKQKLIPKKSELIFVR